MGKWSPDGCDGLLVNKLKTIIGGVIDRSKLDKGEDGSIPPPTISYEAFVEDLDQGDSFTTCLLDALVKELAERRARPSGADKHLISRRTQTSLRKLFDNSRVYRDRSGSALSRRFLYPAASVEQLPLPHLSEWGGPDDDVDAFARTMEDDDDDDMDTDFAALSDGRTFEGQRLNALNADLHEAYFPRPVRRPLPTSVSASASAVEDDLDLHLATGGALGMGTLRRSPSMASLIQSHTARAHSAALHRQPTLRRGVRSRTVDFNDFTSRRRNRVESSPAEGESSSGPTTSTSASASTTTANGATRLAGETVNLAHLLSRDAPTPEPSSDPASASMAQSSLASSSSSSMHRIAVWDSPPPPWNSTLPAVGRPVASNSRLRRSGAGLGAGGNVHGGLAPGSYLLRPMSPRERERDLSLRASPPLPLPPAAMPLRAGAPDLGLGIGGREAAFAEWINATGEIVVGPASAVGSGSAQASGSGGAGASGSATAEDSHLLTPRSASPDFGHRDRRGGGGGSNGPSGSEAPMASTASA